LDKVSSCGIVHACASDAEEEEEEEEEEGGGGGGGVHMEFASAVIKSIPLLCRL
jgi:hypothetical protein